MQMKLLLVLFIVLLAALVFLIFYYVISGHTPRSNKPERKWTDPKFHD